MGSRDRRVDTYVSKSQDFARPILATVREAVHRALPTVEETIKWGLPFFLVDGYVVASMSTFARHARFDVRGSRRPGEAGLTRLSSVEDLPPGAELGRILADAAKRFAASAEVPKELAAALKKSAKARAVFEALPPSHQREYAEWVGEAKKAETRSRRAAETVKRLTGATPSR